MLTLLLIPIVVIGIYPNLLFESMRPAVDGIAQQLGAVIASR
jgi:NADH:ubiquinone oxidoreductase subunit 4 (subunit M)